MMVAARRRIVMGSKIGWVCSVKVMDGGLQDQFSRTESGGMAVLLYFNRERQGS